MPGTLLGAKDGTVNRTNPTPAFVGLKPNIEVHSTGNEQIPGVSSIIST